MTTVITYGTFDLFHQGHYNILKRARDLGDYLIVGVTSESYDIERGKLNVRDSLPTRIQNVLDTGFPDKIIIEEYQGQKINDILKYHVDILVIGSDWLGKFDYLKEYCDVRYLERTKGISSTQIRSETGHLYRVGLATESMDDGSLVEEARYVSGVHVESAWSPDKQLADQVAARYELAESYDDVDAFMDGVDLVYVHTGEARRVDLARRAIAKGKHVICESPVSLDAAEVHALYGQAKEAGVVFAEDIKLPYLRAFTQLIWLLHGGIIGDISRVEIKARCEDLDENLLEMLSLGAYMALKLLNTHEELSVEHIELSSGDYAQKYISLASETKHATIELSESPYWESGVEVFGSEGVAVVPDDWWNMGFFEIRSDQYTSPRRYSFNFEGSGLRYLLQEYLITIEAKNSSSSRFTEADSCAVLGVLNEVLGADK